MPNGLKQPFIAYNHHQNYLYPQMDDEDYREPRTVERFDHVAANGKTLSYYVGPRDFIENTFRWQSDALYLQWITWWEAVRDGDPFYYITIDTIPICGDGSICGAAGLIVGVGDTTDVAESILCKVDMLEFVPEREEVDGFWSVSVRYRRVV